MVQTINIVQELFVNACILISVIFIISQVFNNIDFSYPPSKIKTRISVGIMGGILGIALMFYSINITSTLILDFHHISEVVVTIYGGIFSLTITALISIMFQVFYFGISTNSIINALGILVVSIGCGCISKLNISKKQKWIFMLLYSVIVRSIILLSLLVDGEFIKTIITFLWSGTLVVGCAVYSLVQYLETANKVLKKLQDEASQDCLTGLSNVRNFNKLLEQAKENTILKKDSISVLLIDIDFFKRINDTYGHSAGDSVLKILAHILAGACSKFDIIGRIGGEEFSIVLPRCSNTKAIEIAERIRAVIEKYPFVLPEGKTIYITVSIGVATYPDTTLELENILNEADMALYDAKNKGRNKVSSKTKEGTELNNNI